MPSFLPHDQLLPRVSVGGGEDGVLVAGAPLGVRCGSRDETEVSRWVAWAGVGMGLRAGASQQARIARAVGEVTTRPAIRAGAGELGTAPTATGGTYPADDLLAAPMTR